MKKGLILFSLLVCAQIAFSQNANLLKAESEYTTHNYLNSIKYYKMYYLDLGNAKKTKGMKGSEVKAAKEHTVYQIAECYRMMGDCKQEEQWYAKAMKMHGLDSAKAAIYYAAASKCQDSAQAVAPQVSQSFTTYSAGSGYSMTPRDTSIEMPQKHGVRLREHSIKDSAKSDSVK